MNTNAEKRFVLNNSLAAISAVLSEDSITATDGIECKVHIFDNCGVCSSDCRETLRPYRRLRLSPDGEFFTALGCCALARVYFLDLCFNEFCYIDLDTSDGSGCGCLCRSDRLSELTDASLTVIGEEKFIIGAFRKSAYLFDMNGRRLSLICETEKDEILTDFISPSQSLYAMGTLKGTTQTVTVSDNGIVHSAILERGHTLRMLISSENREIHGLFGRNYIYNKTLPIYSDGILNLPSARGCL